MRSLQKRKNTKRSNKSRSKKAKQHKESMKRRSNRRRLSAGLRLPKPNFGEAAALGFGTYALTGNPRAGLGLGLGSYYAGRLFNTE